MSKLTEKQERFCREYVIDLNGKQAAIRAGYSKRSAKTVASQNMTKLNVLERISELKEEVMIALEATHEAVLAEMQRIAFDRSQNVEVQLRALNILGKHILVRDRFRMAEQEADKNAIGEGNEIIEHVVLYLPDNGRGPGLADDDRSAPRVAS